MNAHHHAATPTLSVIDPRTLSVRSVGYCRHPDRPVIDPRITRQRFDAAGRLVESWDPRLWGTAPNPNLTTIYSLSGQPLLTDSIDAGWQSSLLDQAGSPGSLWDARGSQRHTDYDALLRPVAVTEHATGEAPRVVERLTYGDSAPVFAEYNQCGQLIRHDHPAGTQWAADYGLAGSMLVEEQRFLIELETPDWTIEIGARDELLEAQSFITRHRFFPAGELQCQTDAMGNVRTFGYDEAGKLSEIWLQMAGVGQSPQCLVRNIRYNAQDQMESEIAGNGALTHAEYAADDGRLIRLVSAVGNQKPLQDLNYLYDPVGNIVELHDQSQPMTHFNNQRIDPINRYHYDSLYQLVEAQGWEVSQPSHGPTLPELLPTPLDPNQRRHYTQRFEYDRAGNLISRLHSGAPGFSMFTSERSNRSLALRDDGSLPGEPEIALGFDACGNQRELQRGQAMHWDIRNQLCCVTLVKREGDPDDFECYRYDRPGHRLRKVSVSQANGRTLRDEVRYLPNLEIHRPADGEGHHVISVEAGRSSVRALHWPDGAHDDQLRYSLSDHLGSSTLELDDEAGVLTQEHYYPFGGTACWAGKSVLAAQYKTIRYSGKERDATGLYFYGYRYYVPYLQRWLGPDPAKEADGINMFCFVGNNPVVFKDLFGLVKYKGKHDLTEITMKLKGASFLARGHSEIKKRDPLAAKNLDKGMEFAKVATDRAVDILGRKKLPGEYRELIFRIYGKVNDKRQFESNLLQEAQTIQKSIAARIEGEEKEQVVLAKMKEEMNAFVDRKDSHERLFFTEAGLRKNPRYIGMSIVHELAHLKLGKEDHIYYTSGHAINPSDRSQSAVEADLVSMGEKDSVMAKNTEEHVSKIQRLKHFGVDSAAGIEAAMKRDPALRVSALINNADSFSLLIFSLGYEVVWQKTLVAQ